MQRATPRSGLLRNPWHAFLASAAVLAVLVLVLAWDPRWFSSKKRDAILTVYCAAGVRAPVEEAAERYEELYGVKVRIELGPSAGLLATAMKREAGDLYIPGDDYYLRVARQRGAIDEDLPLAYMRPILAVKRGNPKNIRSLRDALARKDITIAMAEPDSAAIGMLVRENLRKDLWQRLEAKARPVLPSVTEVAGAVAVGPTDAGIIWDVVAIPSKDLATLPIPELRESTVDGVFGLLGGGSGFVLKRESKDVRSLISVGVLRYCQQPDEALRFARFLAARDEGLKSFAHHGYETIRNGDLWAGGEPIIVVYCGAMLKPAVETTLDEFAEREGFPRKNIREVYNGCGILVSQMIAGERPDVFFSCDQRFMDDPEVKPNFIDETVVSTNQLVILVRKGRKDIRTIADLRQADLRIGVGDEHKCAMGLLTSETFRRSGVEREVRKNVVIEAPSGGELVSQMVAGEGNLDAVVAYISNAVAVADELDAYPIPIDCATATQPVAIYRHSDHQHLARRLIRALTSETSRERFEDWGFGWKGGKH